MINILNLNPSIDYFMHTSAFDLNKTNHSDFESVSVGGKGSNVAIVLNNLKVKSVLHGFIGGFTGNFIKSEISKYKYIENLMINSHVLTRINVKLNYAGETEINGTGKEVAEKYINDLENNLKKLKKDDILVMTGRVAKGMSNTWYLKMAKLMNNKGVNFVLDVNDKVILDVLKYKPLLLKPNLDELKNIFDHKDNMTDQDLITCGKKLITLGARHVIISLGSHGSMFFYKDKVFKINNANGKAINTVGAGDAMIAGFLSEYQKSNDPVEAYHFAQACANASAFSQDHVSKDLINKIYPQIKIKEVI